MKIERIEVFPVSYPTAGRFKFLEDPKGRRVGRAAVLVKIITVNGLIGWGESIPVQTWCDETLESATSAIRDYLAPVLIGRDPFDIAGAVQLMNKTISPGFTTGMPLAKCGVDMALHDLAGKALGCSLAQYWGRAVGGPVTLSWTLNPSSLDGLDAMIDEGWKRGYRNFNVKVAPDPKYDLELCRRVKQQVPDGFLWADANGGYDLASALTAAPMLADIGVDVLESPLRPNDISGYIRLKKQGALPIIMDEGVVSPKDLIEFIRLDMLDGVAMKPSRCGGLLSARRQIEILLDAGLMFLGSGLSDPDVTLAASLGLFAAYGLSFPAALNGPQFLTHSVLKSPLAVKDGAVAVPEGYGLGVEIDEERIKAIEVMA
ncbi:MAG: enolase C-terminal domain-like protein [Candidatus Omnitrophota bacterium]